MIAFGTHTEEPRKRILSKCLISKCYTFSVWMFGKVKKRTERD